jgi:hypothetical protein
MKDKLNILLLDDNNPRLHKTTSLMQCCDSDAYCIDPRTNIDQYDYENNDYSIIFVHDGNKEVQDHIYDSDWDSRDAVVVFFSGGFDIDKVMDDGAWWISATYMEKKKNICTLLREVCQK